MKIQELRIGNYILMDETPATIVQFNPDNISFFTGFYKIEPEDYEHPFSLDFDFAKPVKITKKLLIRLGFKIGSNENDCGDYHLLSKFGNFYLRPSYLDGYYWGFDDDNELNNQNPLKFIHQLQNLYYIITNDELIMNKKNY